MSILFADSKTRENLMRAFAGESQARNRYTIAAEQAKKEKLHAISKVFEFTAEQERAHAKVFYELLKESSGQSVRIDGTYPTDVYDNTQKLLRSAQHNELQEYENVYQSFGNTAKEEGFERASGAFFSIAEIERVHAERFGTLAGLLEDNHMHTKIEGGKWMCLNCGYIYDGTEAPQYCPVCHHDRGFFIPLEMSPFNTALKK